MSAASVTILILGLIVVAMAAWIFLRERRSKQLKSRFGPEYHNVVRELGDRTRAEKELDRRARRVERLHIRSLTEAERVRFADDWHHAQSRFVDDPAGAIGVADTLVSEVMAARGYPMADFEHRAEDISVDHPHVVNNYRRAHAIAVRQQEGQADTEDLRKAMVCYRELFDELLEAHPAGHREVRR